MANNKNEETKVELETNKVEETKVKAVVEEKTAEPEVKETVPEPEVKETVPEPEVKEEKDDVEFKPADLKATKFAVYRGEQVVKVFDELAHGADFAKLAKDYADRKGLTAKEYFPELELAEKVDPDTVTIVTKNNQTVRVFSLVAHGKTYKKLAEQFIEKYGERKGYKIKQ